MSEEPVTPPVSGLAAMRIGLEFGGAEGFGELVAHALARGGERGATLVAKLDIGDLGIHIPRIDGPCWNSVPLFHLHHGQHPTAQDWAVTSGVLERLERYR